MINKLYIIFLIIVLFQPLAAADFYILYSSNINGTIQNCNCGKEPLGGVGRIATFIKEFRNINPNTIVIDGGDYFNSYPFLLLNRTMLRALCCISYDVIAPGDQEFVEGYKFYNQFERLNRNKILISNRVHNGRKKLSFNFDKFNVHIYSYLSTKAFSFIKLPEELQLLPFSDIKDTHETGCNVIIFHGSSSEAELVVNETGWIDLILLAHDQYAEVKHISNTVIVGGGRDSEFIVIVAVSKSSGDWKFNISKKKMDDTIKEDQEILEFIQEYHAAINSK